MNFKSISAACLITVLSVGALSATAQANPITETYSYGDHLDINQVISLNEDDGLGCGVVNAQMTYLDSYGEKRVLAYSKLATSCNDGS
jgi:hypothetical protein